MRRLDGIAALLVVCAGCAGTLDDPARFMSGAGADGAASALGNSVQDVDGGCLDVPTQLFAVTCASAGCHSAADKAQGLDLQSPNVALRLVGVCATEGSGMLIDPSNPPDSVVYTKLSSSPPFGVRMPSGKPPLDDATLACVLTWISAQQGIAGSCGGAAPDAGTSEGSSSDDGSAGDAPASDAALD